MSDDGRSGRGSAPFLNLHATARYKEQEKNEDVPIRFHGLIVMLKQNHCRKAVMAPPRRLELRSSAPEADTLSTELRGRATEFYHENVPQVGNAGFCFFAKVCGMVNGLYAFASGASCISSARSFWMICVVPRSSPTLASCSFLWASSPST